LEQITVPTNAANLPAVQLAHVFESDAPVNEE
jgi:hypothetical protein